MTVERANISKANVCPYYGREIPDHQALGLDPDRVYRMLRHPDELALAADTFSHIPLLRDHAAINAALPSSDKWVGVTGRVTYEHPYLIARPLKVFTQDAIDYITSAAKRELSCGYGFKADMTPGQYEGQPFDGVMRQIHGNHVATCEEGRAGPDVLVPDAMPPSLRRALMPLNARVVTVLKPFLAQNIDQKAMLLALDAAMDSADEEAMDCKEDAMDAREEDLDKREEASDAAETDEAKAKDRKTARDARKGARDSRKSARDSRKGARDAAAHNDDFDGAKDANMITKDQLEAALKAHGDKVRADAAALHLALDAVKPVVGIVTCDSAESAYALALKQLGIATDGVPAAAFKALFDVANKAKADPKHIVSDAASHGAYYDIDAIFRLEDVSAAA